MCRCADGRAAGEAVHYEPSLFAQATVRFVDTKRGVDVTHTGHAPRAVRQRRRRRRLGRRGGSGRAGGRSRNDAGAAAVLRAAAGRGGEGGELCGVAAGLFTLAASDAGADAAVRRSDRPVLAARRNRSRISRARAARRARGARRREGEAAPEVRAEDRDADREDPPRRTGGVARSRNRRRRRSCRPPFRSAAASSARCSAAR